MRFRAAIAIIALASLLAACNLTAPFGFGLLFGTSGGYQLGPAVVHAVSYVFGDTISVGLGDIADDGDFFLTLDDSPSELVPVIGSSAALQIARVCTLTSFDISDADAAGVLVQHLVVLERPGLVSGLDDPLAVMRLGTSREASRLFSLIGSVPAAAGDMAQTRYYVDRDVRLIGLCSLGNADLTIDLDLSQGWNPLLLTVEQITAGGRVVASLSDELASDLIWFLD